MSKKVSIIMAAYNAQETIYEAIQSVIHQSYSNWELIVVNDGSKDKTQNVVKLFDDSRIKLYTQNNSGQCSASNKGIEEAIGDFVMFLDADDKMHPKKLENQINSHTSEEDISISAFEIFPSNDLHNENSLFGSNSSEDWIKEMLKSGNYLANSCYLIPSGLIQRVGLYNEQLTLNNDFEFFTRIVIASKSVIYCPEALTFYRREPVATLSARRDLKSLQSLFNARRMTYDKILSKWSDQEMKNLIALDLSRHLYAFFFMDPLLTQQALTYLERLDGATLYPKVSESWFGKIQRIIGFKNAIYLKRIIVDIAKVF